MWRYALRGTGLIKYILIFLLITSPCWGATEWLYPTSETATWATSGAYTDIDECTSDPCTPNDGDIIATTARNDDHNGALSDLVTADADDTYNSVTLYVRTQLTGTPGNEFVRYSIANGEVETHIFQSGSNGSWTTDNSGAINTTGGSAWTYATINAATYLIEAAASGGEAVTQWQCSAYWVVVDYTAVEGSARRIFQSGSLKRETLYPFISLFRRIDFAYHIG